MHNFILGCSSSFSKKLLIWKDINQILATLNLCTGWNMRPVPTKWETSHKNSFESYKQIHDVQTLNFKMIYNMPGLLPYLGSKTHYFLEKFLCFLYWFLKCSMTHISFSSLATCHSFCENRSHIFTRWKMHCLISGIEWLINGPASFFTLVDVFQPLHS